MLLNRHQYYVPYCWVYALDRITKSNYHCQWFTRKACLDLWSVKTRNSPRQCVPSVHVDTKNTFQWIQQHVDRWFIRPQCILLYGSNIRVKPAAADARWPASYRVQQINLGSSHSFLRFVLNDSRYKWGYLLIGQFKQKPLRNVFSDQTHSYVIISFFTT